MAGSGDIVTTWEITKLVSVSDTMVKSDEPPVKMAADRWSVVSLFKKLQVKGPAVVGEQTLADSLMVPVPSETNV